MVLNFSTRDETDARKDFLKSFKNFLSKCPLIFDEVNFEDNTVYLLLKGKEDPFVFSIDIYGDKQSQIKIIKDQLLPHYPIIYIKDFKKLSSEEISAREEAGESLNFLLSEKTIEWMPRYTIIRVHDQYNDIDIQDNKEYEIIKYKLKIPVLTFIEKISYLPKEDTEGFFLSNRKFVEVIKG